MLNIVLLFAALCLVVGQPPPGPRGRGPPLPNQILPLVTSLSTTTVQVIDPRINRTPTLQPTLPNVLPVLYPLHPSLPLFLNPIDTVNINRTPQLILEQPVIVPAVPIPPLRFPPLSDSILTTSSSVRVNVTQSSIISSSPKLKKGVDKRSRTTMPERKNFTRKDTYDKALARYLKNLEEATPEQIATAQAHNTAGNAAYKRAQEVLPQNRSEEESHRVIVKNEGRSEARALSKSNPDALTPSQQRLVQYQIDADNERSEAYFQRRQNPELLTERQHQILAPMDRSVAERAIQIAAERRLAQQTFLGLQLPVHTPVERASMLQSIINALQTFFSANPFAAFNIGSISINAIEYLRLTDVQVLHRMMAADGQSLSEWGRSGTYHPLLRSTITGSYTTIQELERRGGFCIPLHILLDPSSNCLERDLQLLHREHNLYEHGSILNGGLVASGNHYTQTGSLSFLFLTVIPDRRIFFRFPEGTYQPWPSQLPAVTLGDVPVPLPPLPARHFCETFLHAWTNPTEMFRQTRQEVRTQVEQNHIPPSLFDDVPVLPLTRGLTVSGISSTPSLPSTLPRDRTGIDNSPLQRVTRPILTVDFVDDDDDDDDNPVQPIRQIPVVIAHPQDQYPRLSLGRSSTITLQDFMALTAQHQEAMNAGLPRVPFNFDDIDTDNDDDDDNTLGPVAPLHPHQQQQQQQQQSSSFATLATIAIAASILPHNEDDDDIVIVRSMKKRPRE
jgi:hypothetical protein